MYASYLVPGIIRYAVYIITTHVILSCITQPVYNIDAVWVLLCMLKTMGYSVNSFGKLFDSFDRVK